MMFGRSEDKAKPAAKAGHVTNGSEATFLADVIEASREVPVIVDFWAPWCGPCKTLGPALEAAVNAQGGKVRMVKIDVDQAPNLATQLRIQSIPTVYAFFDGRPVDAFQGALPPSEIKQFVEKIAAMAGDGGLAEALAAADAMLAEGAAVDAADAAETYAAILGEDPASGAAYAGLVRAHLALGNLEQAEAMVAQPPVELAKAPELDAARAQVELARQAAKAGPVADLRVRVEAEPTDNQARFDLAQALHAEGDAEGAVDELLELFRRDREWDGGAAKAQLFTIFDALKPQDPLVLRGRRRLSSMIFV